jgi:formylmethanofuran dehydrogenase subunit E
MNMKNFETTFEEFNDLVNAGFLLHGHICPAMPLGIRAGLEALWQLGVKRSKNKELGVIIDNGPAHAALCFADGVQMATGCTFGKNNIIRTNKGKNNFILIDRNQNKAVSLKLKHPFLERVMSSPFVQKRKQGVQPYDIDEKIPLTAIQNMLNTPKEEMFSISSIIDSNFPESKGSFNIYKCEKCHDPVFEPGIRIVDDRHLCIDCSGYNSK